ncbi:pentapeptide repeat-containing protein [Planctomycetota bacterium]
MKTFLTLIALFALTSVSIADIERWIDDSVIPSTEDVSLGPGLDLSNRDLIYAELGDYPLGSVDLSETDFSNSDLSNARIFLADLTGADFTDALIPFSFIQNSGFTLEHLYSTRSYKERNLPGLQLRYMEFPGVDFSEQNLRHLNVIVTDLTGADFTGANLTSADLTTSVVEDAVFAGAIIEGAQLPAITRQQLYSTASYIQKRLPAVSLESIDLSGWDFSDQSMAGASLQWTQLRGTDFSRANLQQSTLRFADLSGVTMTEANLDAADFRMSTGAIPENIGSVRNAIMPDGTIDGLKLTDGDQLVVRRPRPDGIPTVTVADQFTVSDGGTIEFTTVPGFAEKRLLNTKLAVLPETSISLGGTLRIRSSFYSQRQKLGSKYDLFDWNRNLAADNRFSKIELPAGRWDLEDLYVGGSITLRKIGQKGDFDADGDLDWRDVTRLAELLRLGVNDRTFDVNEDDILDHADLRFWVRTLKNTFFGDADLDGEFSSRDFVRVFAFGKFESGESASWQEGDWDGDGVFDSSDFVIAFRESAYEKGPRSNPVYVPEPPGISIYGLVLLLFGRTFQISHEGNSE